jgi:hypothetical protein
LVPPFVAFDAFIRFSGSGENALDPASEGNAMSERSYVPRKPEDARGDSVIRASPSSRNDVDSVTPRRAATPS